MRLKILILSILFSWAFAEERLTEKEALRRLNECKERLERVREEVKRLEIEVYDMSSKSGKVNERVNALITEIEGLKREIGKYVTSYTVKPGDYLYKISGERYVYNNPKMWRRIYRANLDKIKNPNLIYPGWVLRIPRGLDTSIEVIKGDNLWKIAGFPWIYNNPRMWRRIYEANKDKIKNPNLIYPGQVFMIPR